MREQPVNCKPPAIDLLFSIGLAYANAIGNRYRAPVFDLNNQTSEASTGTKYMCRLINSTPTGTDSMKAEFTFTYATVNGIDGRIWTRRDYVGGAWVFQGRQFLPNGVLPE